jgi:hypothetical protein
MLGGIIVVNAEQWFEQKAFCTRLMVGSLLIIDWPTVALVDGTIYNNATGEVPGERRPTRGERFPAELKTPAVKPTVAWSVSVRAADLFRRSAEGAGLRCKSNPSI